MYEEKKVNNCNYCKDYFMHKPFLRVALKFETYTKPFFKENIKLNFCCKGCYDNFLGLKKEFLNKLGIKNED